MLQEQALHCAGTETDCAAQVGQRPQCPVRLGCFGHLRDLPGAAHPLRVRYGDDVLVFSGAGRGRVGLSVCCGTWTGLLDALTTPNLIGGLRFNNGAPWLS